MADALLIGGRFAAPALALSGGVIGQASESCYGDVPMDAGIRSRRIDGVNGLSMHILEAGYRQPDQPLVLLLHGFPELAFSWRKLMPLIAARGYHVIAPDQRGYGATTGWA